MTYFLLLLTFLGEIHILTTLLTHLAFWWPISTFQSPFNFWFTSETLCHFEMPSGHPSHSAFLIIHHIGSLKVGNGLKVSTSVHTCTSVAQDLKLQLIGLQSIPWCNNWSCPFLVIVTPAHRSHMDSRRKYKDISVDIILHLLNSHFPFQSNFRASVNPSMNPPVIVNSPLLIVCALQSAHILLYVSLIRSCLLKTGTGCYPNQFSILV